MAELTDVVREMREHARAVGADAVARCAGCGQWVEPGQVDDDDTHQREFAVGIAESGADQTFTTSCGPVLVVELREPTPPARVWCACDERGCARCGRSSQEHLHLEVEVQPAVAGAENHSERRTWCRGCAEAAGL